MHRLNPWFFLFGGLLFVFLIIFSLMTGKAPTLMGYTGSAILKDKDVMAFWVMVILYFCAALILLLMFYYAHLWGVHL